jgi:hypothetical protein
VDRLDEIAQLATTKSFIERVQAAMVKAAVAVGAEEDDGTPRGQLRRSLSVRVLEASDAWAPRFAWGVATNPVVNHDSSANDIEFTVNSMWDAFSGAAPVQN